MLFYGYEKHSLERMPFQAKWEKMNLQWIQQMNMDTRFLQSTHFSVHIHDTMNVIYIEWISCIQLFHSFSQFWNKFTVYFCIASTEVWFIGKFEQYPT